MDQRPYPPSQDALSPSHSPPSQRWGRKWCQSRTPSPFVCGDFLLGKRAIFVGFRFRSQITGNGYPGRDFALRAAVVVRPPLSNLRHKDGVGVNRRLRADYITSSRGEGSPQNTLTSISSRALGNFRSRRHFWIHLCKKNQILVPLHTCSVFM